MIKKPIKIRVIVPKIRSESEFSEWCTAATAAGVSGDKIAGVLTQPVYMRDDRDYTFGSALDPIPFFRLGCRGNGRFEWPGILNETVNGRMLPYAVKGIYDRCEFTKFEARGACIKPFYEDMEELRITNCYHHDCSNLVGSHESHYSALCQHDLNELNPASTLRFIADNNIHENNGFGNFQFRHDYYVDAYITKVTRCQFINSGNLALNKDPALPEATCEVAYNTWTQTDPGVTQWWEWNSDGVTGNWRNYDYALMGFKSDDRHHVHHNSFHGDYKYAYHGYFATDDADLITMNDNTYNLRLQDSSRFADQLGTEQPAYYSHSTWQSILGKDTSGSTFNIQGIPA